jgi:hypothetical protein
MKNSKLKTTNGWTMTGICSQWAKRNIDINNNHFIIYTDILDKSFSQGRRWCYMAYDDFSLTNRNTISKVLTELEDMNILNKKQTFKQNGHKSKVEYKIIEPMEYISNFVFKKDYIQIDEEESSTEEDWYN